MTKNRPLEERAGPPGHNPSPVMAKRRIPEAYETFGTVRFTLDRLARARGILSRQGKPNRAEIQRRTGVCDETLFYMLRHPELVDRVHFRTLAKICHGLECRITDLLEYTPHLGGPTPLSDRYKSRVPNNLGVSTSTNEFWEEK
jgi:DNA-binding Xre family transcriptional regulator